jgi:hypothetical protein
MSRRLVAPDESGGSGRRMLRGQVYLATLLMAIVATLAASSVNDGYHASVVGFLDSQQASTRQAGTRQSAKDSGHLPPHSGLQAGNEALDLSCR